MMTREEQARVWEVTTKQIDALRLEVADLHRVWSARADALNKLEHERSALYQSWVNEAVNTHVIKRAG